MAERNIDRMDAEQWMRLARNSVIGASAIFGTAFGTAFLLWGAGNDTRPVATAPPALTQCFTPFEREATLTLADGASAVVHQLGQVACDQPAEQATP